MARMNWELARSRELVRERGGAPLDRPKEKPAGITNEQAKKLAALQRQLGVKYTGNGMTRFEANCAIKEAKEDLRGREVLDEQRAWRRIAESG